MNITGDMSCLFYILLFIVCVWSLLAHLRGWNNTKVPHLVYWPSSQYQSPSYPFSFVLPIQRLKFMHWLNKSVSTLFFCMSACCMGGLKHHVNRFPVVGGLISVYNSVQSKRYIAHCVAIRTTTCDKYEW